MRCQESTQIRLDLKHDYIILQILKQLSAKANSPPNPILKPIIGQFCFMHYGIYVLINLKIIIFILSTYFLPFFVIINCYYYYIEMRVLGNVIKSKSDNRLYKAIKLKNQIQCLIISDQQAKKSSAAMSVGVGSLQDPLQAQGLAHYLQHMLFMGTQKYPNENDYSNFISKNFGISNAYTSQDETNYHFQVASNAFQQTLDRFAQFFISPLMSDSSSERQLNAVHSQHSKNILNDMWRKYQLSKYLAKEGHPFKKFSTGNKQSLSNPNLRKMLHDFYNSNYSSNLMKLVVFGNETPEEMSKIVEQKFSQVPNKNYKKYQMLQQPYPNEVFKKLYKILPIQDKKLLEMSWILKDKSKYYENPPSSYLSYVIGHEGQGSLLSFLIREGLATGLSAGGHDSYNCFSQFEVRVSLTRKGVENVRQVIQYIMYFVQTLKDSQPQKWVYDELKDVYRMKFDFLQKRQGMSFTSGLAKKLQNRKIQQVLAYPYFMKEWNPELIKQYLNEMKKENLVIFLQAKQVENECNLVEPIYKTKFAITDFDSLQPRVCPIKFPPKNPFIPKDFDIIPMQKQKQPESIYKSEQFEVFFKRDHRFQLPKMIAKLRLYYAGSNSVKQSLCRKIYLDMLTEKMREFVYLGQSAEIQSSIQFQNYTCLQIAFAGFRDSTLKFIQPYLSQVFSFVPSDTKYFETVKQKMQRALSNYFLSDPYRLAYNLTTMATTNGLTTSPSERLKQIKYITFEDIINFGKDWNKQLYVEAYIAGNLYIEQAKQVLKHIQSSIKSKAGPLPKNLIGDIRAIKLPPGHVWIIQQRLTSKDEANSAVIVHFQHQASTLRFKVLQDLCFSFIKQPAFDYLRTKEQLGYIVMCLPDDNRGVLGMSILVQSAIKTSYELISYVNVFISKILSEKLNQLDEKTFSEYKVALRTTKMEKDKNLQQQSGRYWRQISKHTYQFSRKQKQLKQIQQISLQQFKNFVNLIFYINPKRVQVHLTSQKQTDKNEMHRKERLKSQSNLRIFSDAQSFRKKMDLYPDFYSHL